MKMTKTLLLASAIGLVAVWSVGCGGGNGGGSASRPATPPPAEGGSSDTPAVEVESGTPSEGPSGDAPAAGAWGTLKGRFVFAGTAPTPEKENVNKDVEFCAQEGHHPIVETLLVNPENGGLKNVVISLYVGRSGPKPEVHESYKEVTSQPVRLDNEWCRFEPHIRTVVTGQELVIGNKDEVGHNTKADLFKNPQFNETLGVGQDITKTFEQGEGRPAPVSCSIHPWMKGYLVIEEHPYVAVTDADGNFEIANVPTGRWTFQVWHEVPGNVEKVSHGGSEKTWQRGRVEWDVNEGDNDLGEITVSSDAFSG